MLAFQKEKLTATKQVFRAEKKEVSMEASDLFNGLPLIQELDQSQLAESQKKARAFRDIKKTTQDLWITSW